MLSVTVEVNFGIIKILMLILVPVFVCVCVLMCCTYCLVLIVTYQASGHDMERDGGRVVSKNKR